MIQGFRTLNRNQLNSLSEAFRRYRRFPEFNGADIGFKERGGITTPDVAVRIHFEAKLPEALLTREELVPPFIGDLETDVIAAEYKPTELIERLEGDYTAFPGATERQQTIYPSLSIAHGAITAGTLGALVYDRVTGFEAILSNWHVMAGEQAMVGDPIYQPGPYDIIDFHDESRRPYYEVANLYRAHLGLEGDMALAILNTSRSMTRIHPITHDYTDDYLAAHPDDSDAPRRVELVTDDIPRLGEVLEKDGRTTGHTQARVEGIGFYRTSYGGQTGSVEIAGAQLRPINHPLTYENNIEISHGGDSGSIWYRWRRRAVGTRETATAILLNHAGEFSGIPDQERGIGSFVVDVRRKMDFVWRR